jgi:Cof subfamily protein (haloacid dehalogenase superfamily)
VAAFTMTRPNSDGLLPGTGASPPGESDMAEPSRKIDLLISDIDGTLLTPGKTLTARARGAVRRLQEAGIGLKLVSSRPPRGMSPLLQTLGLTGTMAGFNGGQIFTADLTVVEEHPLPVAMLPELLECLRQHTLDAWLYRGCQWLVPRLNGPHVEREIHAVGFAPVLYDRDALPGTGVVKVVGVSDDSSAVAHGAQAVRDIFADQLSVSSSQPYYLDITHPLANKGVAVQTLARGVGIDLAKVATIGDMAADTLMFAQSAMSIAMGNAEDAVKSRATYVTTTNAEEGFARAVEKYILAR